MATFSSTIQIAAGLCVLGLVACGGKEAPTLEPAAAPAAANDSAPGLVTPAATTTPESPDVLRSVPTDIDDPLAQAICKDIAAYRGGTFNADAFFGVDGATGVSATVDEYQPGDSPDAYSGLTLSFHRPTERGNDATHGAFLHETARKLRLHIGGVFPDIAVQTYADQSISTLEDRSLCFADAVGGQAETYNQASADIEHAQVVITAHTATMIEGTITTSDGAHRLDFKAPIALGGFPKEGPICCFGDTLKADTPPKLAPACVAKPASTFTASPAFGFAEGTRLEVHLDQRYFSDAYVGVFLRFELSSPSTLSKDTYGDSLHRKNTSITVPLDTPFPTIPPGTYDASTWGDEHDELCYPDGIGYLTSLQTKSLDAEAKLTITSQTDKQVAGVLELPGGRTLDFNAPITPTPIDPPRRPECCRP